MKDVNFAELRALVERQLEEFVGEPAATQMVPSVPHRQPAADPPKDEEPTDADQMYDFAYDAREATELLVAKLEDPIFDDAFEYAFRASACLRKVLNSLMESGARPKPDKRVVAPRKNTQKYFGYHSSASPLSDEPSYSRVQLEEEDIRAIKSPELRSAVQILGDLSDEDFADLTRYHAGMVAGAGRKP